METKNFVELSAQELQEIDGGCPITFLGDVAVAAIKWLIRVLTS